MPTLPPTSEGRLQTLDLLRGVAALMVCWCHFSPTLPALLAKPVEHVGATGVPIFFVISGFIIPWGLLKVEYTLGSFPRFILKRMARLHPPYLLSLVMTLVLSFLAAAYLKKPMHDSFVDMLLATVYLKVPPENPVYWTLAIELQYYITLGVIFSLVFHRIAWIRHLAFIAMLGLGYLGREVWPFAAYLPFFAFGFLVVWHFKHWTSMALVCVYVVPVAALAALGHGLLWTGIAVVTTGLIALVPDLKVPRPFLFLGMISYSLYLIHFPLGVKAMNLLMPRMPDTLHIGLFIALNVLVVGAAWIFYVMIERPAVGWSSKVRLKRDPPPPAVVAATQPATTSPFVS